MPFELDLYGVYLPGFFGLMLVAFLVTTLFHRLASRVHFYALVWHRALFNLALYVLVLGALFFLSFEFVK